MDRLVLFVCLLAFVFCITYAPRQSAPKKLVPSTK
jgi:hypothetical protein